MIPATMASNSPSLLKQELLRHMPLYRKAQLFGLIGSLMVLAPTFFMLQVYGRVVNSGSNKTLLMMLILVIGAYVVMELLELASNGIMREAALKVDAGLRELLFNAAFEANLRRGGGNGHTQVFSDLKTLCEFMSSPAVRAIMDVPASVLFLLLVFMIHPMLGVIALLSAVIQVVIAVRTEKTTMPTLAAANQAAIEAQGYASGALRNTQVIEAMGMMAGIQRRWMGMQRRFLQKQADASDHNGLNNVTGRFIQMTQGSLILGASCWFNLKGGLAGGGGMMIVVAILGGRVLAPLVQLVAQWRLVVNARDAYGRLDAVLGSTTVPSQGMSLPAPAGHLTVEAVVAGAPGSPAPILKGVSFSAQPGEVVVVVGPSAAGKTTLARLLTGIWPASSGKVRLDGVDIYAWDKDELGPHVGYLPQGVELFDGTLADNIARFGEVDMDKVRAAAVMVGLDPIIEALPDGYGSRIGEEGGFLSGGQRQRVGLARAVYGMPRFLVLDEPNSSLDEVGEQALVDALRLLKAAACTTIVMSHRSSVLAVADKMLMLREGQVALFGPRDEVLAALKKAAGQAPPKGIAHATKLAMQSAQMGGAS